MEVRRGRAPELSWRGGKDRIRNAGRVNQRNLWSAFRAWAGRCRAWERNTQQGREEGGQGRSGWPVVDIKGWPCWISGSGDGYAVQGVAVAWETDSGFEPVTRQPRIREAERRAESLASPRDEA